MARFGHDLVGWRWFLGIALRGCHELDFPFLIRLGDAKRFGVQHFNQMLYKLKLMCFCITPPLVKDMMTFHSARRAFFPEFLRIW